MTEYETWNIIIGAGFMAGIVTFMIVVAIIMWRNR